MEYLNNFSNDAKHIFLQLFFLTIVQINACMCLTFFLGETLNLPSQSLTLCSQRHTEHRIVAVMIVISTECALTRLLTNDDHPSFPIFALHRPERHKMTLEKLGRPPMNWGELRWTKTGRQINNKTERQKERTIDKWNWTKMNLWTRWPI